LNTEHQTPAFVCDLFSVQLSTRDIDNLDQSSAATDNVNNSNVAEPPPATGQSDSAQRRRSVRALRAALGRVTDVPHSAVTTRVDFVVSCSDVTQHVNMSLLRLTHQIVTMVENINKTRTELRRNAARSCLIKPNSGTWTHSDIRRAATVQQTLDTGEQHLKGRSPVVASVNRPDTLPGVHHSGRVKLDIPLQTQASPSFTISMDTDTNLNAGGDGDASSPAVVEERTIVDEIRENTPKCWRTLYHLLDLYSTMPELKTINRSQLSVIEEEEQNSPALVAVGGDKIAKPVVRNVESVERQPLLFSSRGAARSLKKPNAVGTFTQSKFVSQYQTQYSVELVTYTVF